MPNRTRKRAARFDEETFREDQVHLRRNAKRSKVLPKHIGNSKTQPAAAASTKPKAKPKAAPKAASSSSSAVTSHNAGCFNTTWTPEEDQELRQIVEALPGRGITDTNSISWIEVAATIGTGRTAKQVRERWHNSLRPDLKRKGAPWSERETATLIRLQHEWGNKWAKIGKAMVTCGRSQNDLKNKWNSLMKNRTFRLAHAARQKEVEMEGRGDANKKKTASSKGIATFAATMARKLCSRSNYTRNDEDDDLAATSEESESEDEVNADTSNIEVEEKKITAKTKKQYTTTKTVNKEQEDDDCEMTEDGSGHLLQNVEQSDSQLEFGRKLEEYKWAVEQERKIELFRRGRLDSGLTCRDVERLKLMGLGLGVDALRKKYFGSAAAAAEETNLA